MEHVLCKHLNPPEDTRGKDRDSGHSALTCFILGPQRHRSRATVGGDLRIGWDFAEDDQCLMAGFSTSLHIGMHFCII